MIRRAPLWTPSATPPRGENPTISSWGGRRRGTFSKGPVRRAASAGNTTEDQEGVGMPRGSASLASNRRSAAGDEGEACGGSTPLRKRPARSAGIRRARERTLWLAAAPRSPLVPAVPLNPG